MLTDVQQRHAAKVFAEKWAGRGYEKGETHAFWIELLRTVLGVEYPESFVSFETQVLLGHTSFIDAYIPETKVMIEQKGLHVDLDKPAKQSDGSFLTPYQQAKRYADELELSKKPRYIVVCNFKTFHIHDMEHPHAMPEVLELEDLPTEYYRLSFLTDLHKAHLKREMALSIQAGEIVGQLYDAILKQYLDPTAEHTLKSLNMLCVRLVFCLYAEDAGIFGAKNQFYDYLKRFEPRDIRRALMDLFRILNTKEDDRDPYEHEDLLAFPYVNGGLFAEADIEIPQFDATARTLLLEKASDDFNWSDISPTIFGAVFESTLNPETRRAGGMHYTSIENIHKVIDPLFLDDLRAELEDCLSHKALATRNKKLHALQDKLASLTFLDPACGSGNFLTETYLSLRHLENRILSAIYQDQALLGLDDVIKVNINQFYGIEINDFAVTVAKTALWIAESQMMKATEDIVHRNLDFLPLKSYVNIAEGNALRLDWNTLIPKEKLHYIMGNPPFIGHQWRSKEQVADMDVVFADFGNYGKLDYVASWFKKAADVVANTSIKCAFVTTNSLVQGESVATMWKPFFEQYHMKIDFAWRTFRWDSEAIQKAQVHCVIVGFSDQNIQTKRTIFIDDSLAIAADNINGYLLNAPSVFIQNRGAVLKADFPRMSKGSQPTDGGNLLLNKEDAENLIAEHSTASIFVKRFIGAEDYINNKYRYCLWLKGVAPSIYRNIPFVMNRLEKVAEMRRNSPTKSVQKDAETPMLFTQIRQPTTNYLVVPEVSSERRKYIPIGYMSPEVVASNMIYVVANESLFMFGVLISLVHMAWMRVVAGRLKSDYRYTPAVYNNFPWPEVSEAQRLAIEQTAQGILDARALYPDCSLADLYDETTMPPELRKAHQANDRAVMKAYGYAPTLAEPEIVADLMKRYQTLTQA